jgi:hypothetical protein
MLMCLCRSNVLCHLLYRITAHFDYGYHHCIIRYVARHFHRRGTCTTRRKSPAAVRGTCTTRCKSPAALRGTCTTRCKSPAACERLAPLDASLLQPARDLHHLTQILNERILLYFARYDFMHFINACLRLVFYCFIKF